MLSRRQTLQIDASGLAALPGLIAPARASLSMPFGGAERLGLLDTDSAYSRPIRHYCTTIPPEGRMPFRARSICCSTRAGLQTPTEPALRPK